MDKIPGFSPIMLTWVTCSLLIPIVKAGGMDLSLTLRARVGSTPTVTLRKGSEISPRRVKGFYRGRGSGC